MKSSHFLKVYATFLISSEMSVFKYCEIDHTCVNYHIGSIKSSDFHKKKLYGWDGNKGKCIKNNVVIAFFSSTLLVLLNKTF